MTIVWCLLSYIAGVLSAIVAGLLITASDDKQQARIRADVLKHPYQNFE